MTYKECYSEKEQRLFNSLNYGYLMDVIGNPPTAYDLVAMELFVQNKSGNLVDSVRRCVGAIKNCSPYRMTKEFDDLIEFDD